jgi:multicomponent Na+:H+ antiporter subunit D
VFEAMPINEMLIGLGLLAMVAGALTAIWQTNAKRLLAYSSISQIGYMVLGIGLADINGLAGSVVHIFNHAMSKAMLFVAIGCVVYRVGASNLVAIRGFARRMPVTAACVVLGGLSLVGTPLTLGFVTKWLLLQGALDRGWWWIAFFIVVSSLLALVYVWRIVATGFLYPASGRVADIGEAPAPMLVALLGFAAVNVVLGIDGSLVGDFAVSTAESLFAGDAYGGGQRLGGPGR